MQGTGWTDIAERWQAANQGGWLVVGHWRREHCALAWRDVRAVTWVSEWGRWAQPTVLIEHNFGQNAYPCHEVAAQRLRHWWREARDQRVQVPRWREVAQVLDDPGRHGGRRWMSRLVLAVGDQEAFVLGGLDTVAAPGRLHQLSFEFADPALATALEAPPVATAGEWRLHEGVGTYVFDWCRPTFGRRHGSLTGVLAIDHFRGEMDAPMAPSGPHAGVL
ncbi:MAG: hypothetical protein HZB16_01775 [Armatimonadetes bacterium]|nr:hypothetical protein [Armatimonadota bacterium]